VPLYSAEAAAGGGRDLAAENVVDHFALGKRWIYNVLHTTPNKLALITAVGDSMEPTIRSGDLVLVDRGIERIADDAIYVLEYAGQLKVKRVQRDIRGHVVVRSDNPAYHEERLDAAEASQLTVVGRVCMVARLT